MTNRVPSSPRPPGKAQQPQRVRRPRELEKPKPVKVGGAAAETSESPEVGLWGGKDYDKSLAEVSLKDIENLAQEQSAADEAHSDKAKEHRVEVGEQAEREDGAKANWSTSDKPSAPRPEGKEAKAPAQAQAKPQQGSAAPAKQGTTGAWAKLPEPGPAAAKKTGQTSENRALTPSAFAGATRTGQTSENKALTPSALAGAARTGQTSENKALNPSALAGAARTGQTSETKALSGTSFTNLAPAGQVQTARLQGTSARTERPPDAFALLKEARPKGGFYVEDAMREGHTEDQEDPRLAAAVEECIRLCFGVKGILRIGAGKNDRAEPVVVVVATTGFSEASLTAVPTQVLGFPTLLAISFELLPLRRER